ncbi:uncharacterized protein isoform X2 [Choristoneura fumiferana]|uniref:uncharacterized protein isoform X2 n=1 Tax=Choristoneura fumiferana TaxID=7141 RepID=UPI003D157EC0
MFGEACSGSGSKQLETGTALVTYNPVLDTEVIVQKNGRFTSAKVKLHCITIMKEYENKSIEELRLEDHRALRCKWSTIREPWVSLSGDLGKLPETKPPFLRFNKPAETKPHFGGFGKPAETKSPFGGFNKPAETKSPFWGFDKPAETYPPFGVFDKPAQTKPCFGGFGKPAETKSPFGGFNKPAETKSPFWGFDKPAETYPPFGGFDKPTQTKPCFGGFGKPAETKSPFLRFNKPAETKSPNGKSGSEQLQTGTALVKYSPVLATEVIVQSNGRSKSTDVKFQCITIMKEYENKSIEELRLEDRMAGRGRWFHYLGEPWWSLGSVFDFGQPAQTKPLFRGFDKPAEAKSPNGQSGGLGEGAFGDTSGEGTSTVAFGGTCSNIPCFNLGDLSNDVRSTNKMQLCSRNPKFASQSERSLNFQNSQSLVYKCNACGLCFDREEVMFKHLIGCSPIKIITRIHCVCGLEFDTNNYDYHCEVHREFTTLKKKDITITDLENIDLRGMKEKFMRNKKKGIVSDAEHKCKKIKASAEDYKYTAEEASICENRKSCVVYRCNCRLSFERPEFLLSHLNNCDPGEKITRIHCMCGLEFDEDNYDYHSEVHLIFTRLKVKKISVNGDKIIPISSMKQEFAKDDERKAVKSTKEAQVQTEHLNERFVKNSAAELFFKGDGTFEQLLGQKIVSAVVDTIESGIDGKESQTKITIIIAKESEKTVECPNKTNTGDKNNEVTDIRTSETTTRQKVADNTTNDITAPTEGDHATDNHAKADIALNENIPKNKAVNSCDPADGETTEITEQIEQLNINITSALTLTVQENKAIDNPDPKNSGTNAIMEPTDQPNKINSNQDNSDISTNETCTPSELENKAIASPEPLDDTFKLSNSYK